MSDLLKYIDTYSLSHLEMYPDLLSASAYLTFRRRPSLPDEKSQQIVWFGLSYLINTALRAPLSKEDVEYFLLMAKNVYGRGIRCDVAELFRQIPESFGGHLPIRIYSLPEGVVVNPGAPLVRVEAEGPYSGFVTLLEGLLVQTWYPSLVATRCLELRKIISGFARQSISKERREQYLSISVMDWSFRSSSSRESAFISGLAYNLFFSGVAKFCVAGHPSVRDAISDLPNAIHATSHSVVLAHKGDSEFIQNIERFASDNELIEIVIDTFSTEDFIKSHLPVLVKLNRSRGFEFLLAPDSGNQSLQMLRLLNECEILGGYEQNEFGYKKLRGFSVVLGDEMNEEKVIDALTKCLSAGYSVENVYFGLGSAISQREMTRDHLSASFQLSEVTTLDEIVSPVHKSVQEDQQKASLSGRLGLDANDNAIDLRSSDAGEDRLVLVYDGLLENPVSVETYKTIRNRVMIDQA